MQFPLKANFTNKSISVSTARLDRCLVNGKLVPMQLRKLPRS